MSDSVIKTKPVTIFVVDDDDIDVMSIERALKKLKNVNPMLRAKDGAEALEMLTQKTVPRPYIILLDINMPRLNGLDLLKQLRADPDILDAVVFMFTTSKDEKDKKSAYKQHVAGYVVKEHVGDGVMNVVEMLDSYCRAVEFPIAD